MPQQSDPSLGINAWLEDELYQQYLHDRRTVDESWTQVFESNGHTAPPQTNGNSVSGNGHTAIAVPTPAHQQVPGEQLMPLRGAAARIAENMTASLSIPVATSQRIVPMKAIEENRRIINEHSTSAGRGKISYTHLIGWAVVKALDKYPKLNDAFVALDGEIFRAVRSRVNLGIAVDVAGKDGSRSLMAPNLKDAGSLSFGRYVDLFDDTVSRARSGKLAVGDFEGTTITLTNPGTVGTIASVPRLMNGQGAIIATGAIDYPTAFQGMPGDLLNNLGVSKVMTVTCTYDHRVIQGAESGMFLGRVEELLEGEDSFYDEIFAELRIPFKPVRWEQDRRETVRAPGLSRSDEAAKEAAVLQLVRVYRVRGHLMADLDPLATARPQHPDLDPETYGLTIWDLDREFNTGTLLIGGERQTATLREILETLRQTYCGTLTCEYYHIQHPEERLWLEQRMEPTMNRWELPPETRMRALRRVIEAEEFEHFLHNRFVGHKRFSLEGAESAIAILDETLEQAADQGVKQIVIGMAHRGRLNVLANVIGKSMVQVFSEFEGNVDPYSAQGSGDVKYHLGASGRRVSAKGNPIDMSVAFNPSHLEAVDPVVEGLVRPRQDRMGDTHREKVIPLLIHGDAAFAGQGVVAETLNLSQLEGYTTGGTIHLVINNQIGFTTNPKESRSATYSTDVARMVQAPIIHVNGDDPEACLRAAQLAYGYRQEFKRDVVIDMVCYRRHGHNEGDDPSYTQPILYRKIKDHPSVATIYGERLVRAGLLSAEQVKAMSTDVTSRLNELYEASRRHAEKYEPGALAAVDMKSAPGRPETAISAEALQHVVNGITTFPPTFHVHPKLKGLLEKRRQAISGGAIDWATGEALAFGSLVLQGTPVRLSGQDSSRGTFSQRHLEYYDYEDGLPWIPMQHLSPDQAPFNVWDSSLSEYAVMGFEFGYSVADPLSLVLWEAQFGVFANGAQLMIDQFIASAESKWNQPSGLVLLLPHGYEGQGPEHSSARMERWLQLCAENNLQVANCSTPAQYFHLLRRQMYGGSDRRGMRKPLIVFTPKSILRHPRAVSTINDLTSGGFREILGDSANLDGSRVRRVLLCSGQLYYDLLASREQRKIEDVAILRLEQIYPFPEAELKQALSAYPAGVDLVWVQEEPRNMGAWRFVQEQLAGVRYVGRPESASPSAGSLKRHTQEQGELIDIALDPDPTPAQQKPRTAARRRRP